MNKKLLSDRNKKLGKDTLVFNMTPYKLCPSKRLGLCKLGKKCYTRQAELQYKHSLPYRMKQYEYWVSTTAKENINDLNNFLSRKRKKYKYFRLNESGDFITENCINKIKEIANNFKDIQFYTYTHRTDLIKYIKDLPNNLCINISNKKFQGFNEFKAVKEFRKNGKYKCKMDCKTCNLCKTNKNITIECKIH